MTIKFGWKAGTEQYPPQQLLEYAVAAEQAGFDSIDVSDHFHPWSEQGQACFVWTWLGAAAVRTQKIILGTGVTCPILRYHPAIIAQAAATLAVFAPGRSFLGLGTGEALNEYSATGLWPNYQTRQAQLAEAVQLIRALWKGDPVSYSGAYFKTRRAKLYTRAETSPPIFISALVPRSARFAGRYGDGLITVGGENPETYKDVIKSFAAGATEAGKDPERMPRMIEIAVDFTDNEEQAIEARKAYWAGTFVPALFTERIYTPALSEQNGRVVGADTIRDTVCISPDPEAHIKLARHYIELGFDHLIFQSAGPDQRAFLDAYGRRVLPRLRQ
jgi:coenzyme F420-dependent glucose-6-phosphate dehydrogenase